MKNSTPVIGIAGAGKTGMGIARLAASSGHKVYVYDSYPQQLEKSRQSLQENADGQSGKDKTPTPHSAPPGIVFTDSMTEFGQCDYIIEAVIEQAEVKKDVLMRIEGIAGKGCIIATGTSSLSVSALSSALKKPGRFLGIHGVHPSPVPKLFEIVPGLLTQPDTLEGTAELIRAWNTAAVTVKDIPGFLFNRLAYPFYHEALAVLEEGKADAAAIDTAMKEHAGFEAGPFELLNAAGIGYYYRLSDSLFRASFFDPRFRPSYILKQIAEAGLSEWKFSEHRNTVFTRTASSAPDVPGTAIADRILAVMTNYACELILRHGILSEEIDLAATKGLANSTGPLARADKTGLIPILNQLNTLYNLSGNPGYRPSPLLKRMAENGHIFYPKA